MPWNQPIGESQVSTGEPDVPDRAHDVRRPMTAPVIPYAARGLLVSWAASSATAAKTRPTAAWPTPSPIESAAASGNASAG